MSPLAPPQLLLQRCRVLDTVLGECPEQLYDVLVADGVIRAIKACGGAQSSADEAAAGARVIDCGGRVLMPGEGKASSGLALGLVRSHMHWCTSSVLRMWVPPCLLLPRPRDAANHDATACT